MTRPIGYYVHHQGAGHWQRARGIAALSRHPVTLIGTLSDEAMRAIEGPVLPLPDDRMDAGFEGLDGSTDRPQAFHYVPLGHPGIRGRMAAIAGWVDAHDPVLMVVDVSVEVALFARLLSVPTLVVRLAGLRTDAPHLEAFRAAERLIAPFPTALEDPETPDWVRAKTIYAGFLGPSLPPAARRGDDIVVLLGRGGEAHGIAALAEAARAVPGRTWHVLGEVEGREGPSPNNFVLHGWVDDVPARVAGAALVVGAAGDGVVAVAAAAGTPFLCLPEPRAYGEQTLKAAALARLGAAVVHEGWPGPDAWPGLVERTLALDPSRLSALAPPDAMPRLAGTIDAIADEIEARPRPGC